jgi:hypothetical protein
VSGSILGAAETDGGKTPAMMHYRRLVDDIRAQLNSLSAPEPGRIEQLATEQREICAAVNQRLRQCADLLSRGLRTDAIQQCEEEPNLVQVVSVLDFPELPQWLDSLARRGVPGPPALMLDTAAELNEAYARHQPIKDLLRMHRRLALQRAPLAQRIDVLRRLSERDPETTVFRQDLKEYETTRWAQISKEWPEAHRRGDSIALERFQTELAKKSLSVVPPLLLKAVGDATHDIRKRQGCAQLRELAPRLLEAFSQLDLDAGRALREQFNHALELAAAAADHAVVASAASALEWLAAEDDRETERANIDSAIGRLQARLDQRPPSVKAIEAAYTACRELGAELPGEVELQYRGVVSRLLRRQRLQRVATVAGIVLFLAAITGLGWRIIARHRYTAELTEHVNTINDLLAQDQLADAGEYFKKIQGLSPQTANDPVLLDLAAIVRERTQKEMERSAAFQAALQAATVAAAEHPEQVPLENVTRLAKTPIEQESVAALFAGIKANKAKRQKKIDDDFSGRVASLHDELSAAAKSAASQDQLRSVLQKAEAAVATLAEERQSVSAAPFERLAGVRHDIEQIEAKLEEQTREHDLEQRITTSIGNPELFAGALRAYAAAFPSAPSTAEFTAVLPEEKLWKGLLLWNDLATRWQRIDPSVLTSEQLAGWINSIRDASKSYPGFPQTAAFEVLLRHLEAYARRSSSGSIDDLRERFHSPLISGAWMVERDGKRYYTSQQPALTKSGYSFRYWIGHDERTKSTLLDAENTKVETAPQAKAAERVDKELSKPNLKAAEWEPAFCRMIDAVVEQRTMDPVLKAFLLSNILAAANDGSEPIRVAFEKPSELLRSLEPVMKTPWMDPADKNDADWARQNAASVLEKFNAALPASKQRAADELKKFQRFQVPMLEWCGWLRALPNGEHECIWSRNNLPAATVDVILPGNKLDQPALDTIGTWDGARFTPAAGAKSWCKSGRPIFAIRANTTNGSFK